MFDFCVILHFKISLISAKKFSRRPVTYMKNVNANMRIFDKNRNASNFHLIVIIELVYIY